MLTRGTDATDMAWNKLKPTPRKRQIAADCKSRGQGNAGGRDGDSRGGV